MENNEKSHGFIVDNLTKIAVSVSGGLTLASILWALNIDRTTNSTLSELKAIRQGQDAQTETLKEMTQAIKELRDLGNQQDKRITLVESTRFTRESGEQMNSRITALEFRVVQLEAKQKRGQ